jgi:hypothetical protein
MLPYWLPQAAKSASNFVTSLFNRPKNMRDTGYGQYLNKIRTEGVINPLEKRQIMGGVARTSGALGGRRREAYLGRLQAAGAGGSIAGEERAADFGSELQQQLGETSQNVDVANVQSKRAAEEAYAQGVDQQEEAKKNWGQNLVQNILGGGAAVLQSVRQGQMLEKYGPNAIPNLVNKLNSGEITKEQFNLELLKLGKKPEDIMGMSELFATQ